MNTFPENKMDPTGPPENLSLTAAEGHAEHVIRLAKQLADGNRPGVLATIDETGKPQLRWMETLSLEEFPHLYALTSPTSRKVEQIRHHPQVTWMFNSATGNTVVNLSGTATIVTEPSVVNRVWRMIENKANAYFLALNTEAAGIAVIDTVIEGIDCVIPKYGLHYPPRESDFPLLFRKGTSAE